MSAGYVLAILGIWVGCQVLGGNALQRLKLVPATSSGSSIVGQGVINQGLQTLPQIGGPLLIPSVQ